MANASVHKVGITIKNRVGSLVLNRPPLNVMNIAMMNDLHEAIAKTAGQCDVLILRGANDCAFSAGAEVADHLPDRVGTMLRSFHGVLRELWRSKIVTIAAVRGHCLGGGCELATFCDFVVAAESATFGVPEIKLGCFPPLAMVIFPRLVGLRVALDLILSGRTISAVEARRVGLVTRVVSDAELDKSVALLADELHALSPNVLAMTRSQLWKADGFDFEASLRSVEKCYLSELMKTHDANEGIRAFLEKRQPAWQSQPETRKGSA